MLTERDLILAREGMKKTLRALFVKTKFPDVSIWYYNHALRSHGCCACRFGEKVHCSAGYYKNWYVKPIEGSKKCGSCKLYNEHSKYIPLLEISEWVKEQAEIAIELPEIKEMIKLKAAINKMKNKIKDYEARKHKINVLSALHLHGETG